MADRPATKSKRLFRLASMTAQVAGGYAKSRVKALFQSADSADRELHATHQRSGELIAQTLGELKGAVMKVGQMASLARDLLPRELSEALGSLQREAPPMPYDVIAEQITAEFGSAPERLFRRIERIPFAAASIGQVHRATTDDGREVVVKVQYPGVDEAVDSDLAHLKLALRASGLVRVKKQALDALFGELKARLHEELDYCNEADNVRFFRDHYRDHRYVIVPEVVAERSSQRVLTLSFERGDPLAEIEGYPQDVRDLLGTRFFEMFAEQLFSLQVIHADPNPANFACRRDGTIVIYDFGCIKRLDPAIVSAYRDTLKAGLDGDYAAIEGGLRRLGARNLDGPAVPLSYYEMWRNIFAEPFLSDGLYDYGRSEIHREALRHIPKFLTRYAPSFQPPPELVFVNRVVVGHYGNLRRLGARGSYGELLSQHLHAA